MFKELIGIKKYLSSGLWPAAMNLAGILIPVRQISHISLGQEHFHQIDADADNDKAEYRFYECHIAVVEKG
jgi:hypothetical protein